MGFAVAKLNAAVDAALTGSTHIQAHTGEPGAAGTSNVATNCARAALSGVGSAAGGVDTITATFNFTGPSGAPVTVTFLWPALTGGTHNTDAAGGTLTPPEEFAVLAPWPCRSR